MLFLRIEDEHGLRKLFHVANTAEIALQLDKLAIDEQRFLLRHRLELARVAHALVVLHFGHALGDGLVVGEHSAQPAFVDVGHVAAFGVGLNRVLGLLFRADEQHRAAVGDKITNEYVGLLEMAQCLMKIHDVDP